MQKIKKLLWLSVTIVCVIIALFFGIGTIVSLFSEKIDAASIFALIVTGAVAISFMYCTYKSCCKYRKIITSSNNTASPPPVLNGKKHEPPAPSANPISESNIGQETECRETIENIFNTYPELKKGKFKGDNIPTVRQFTFALRLGVNPSGMTFNTISDAIDEAKESKETHTPYKITNVLAEELYGYWCLDKNITYLKKHKIVLPHHPNWDITPKQAQELLDFLEDFEFSCPKCGEKYDVGYLDCDDSCYNCECSFKTLKIPIYLDGEDEINPSIWAKAKSDAQKVKCPKCKEKFSNTSDSKKITCPKCGHVFVDYSNWNIGCGCLLIILIIIFIFKVL